MLKHFHVRGFKSIDDMHVEMAPLVVIFGPNAAGKSNLLDAQLLLSRIVTERTLADAFAPPMRGYPLEAFTLPKGGLEELLGMSAAKLSLEAVVRTTKFTSSRPPPDLRYRIGVRIHPATGALGVVEEHLERLKQDGTASTLPRIEATEEHLVLRRVNEQGQPRHEPLGLNHSLASNLQFTGDRYPDLDRLRTELGSWRSYYLDPRVAMREAQPPREVDDIGPLGQYLAPFLYRLKESKEHSSRFRAIRRALHSAIPAVDDLDVVLDRSRGTLDIRIVQDGTPYSSRVVSEGTLRVLALCAIAVNPWQGSLVAFEEPENGVHPRRIEVIADLLVSMSEVSGSQVVVTTHSPTLVAAMGRKQSSKPDQIRLLACSQPGRSTILRPIDAGSLFFDDKEITMALESSREDGIVEAMLKRGWLDG